MLSVFRAVFFYGRFRCGCFVLLIIKNSLLFELTKKYGLLAGDKKCSEFQGKESLSFNMYDTYIRVL